VQKYIPELDSTRCGRRKLPTMRGSQFEKAGDSSRA
jgi:hypothetical protein